MSDVNKNEVVVDDLKGSYLTFFVDESVYGVELYNVIEIISIQAITVVPHVPEYVKGIINLRGKIVPVIDVRTKFALNIREYDDHTSIVVLNYQDMQLGIIVDRVSDVVNANNSAMVGLPNLGEVERNKYLGNVMKIGDRLVLTIDLDSFFSEDLECRGDK